MLCNSTGCKVQQYLPPERPMKNERAGARADPKPNYPVLEKKHYPELPSQKKNSTCKTASSVYLGVEEIPIW
jgi:hypothetical protein